MEYATAALSILKFLFDLSVADVGEPRWVEGKGEVAITRELSEAEACARSENRAKLNALRKLGGERISSDTLMHCTDDKCPLSRFTWAAFDGLIKDIKDKVVTVEKTGPFQVCYTVLQAYVDVGKGEPDPDFDLTVRIPRKVFQHQDVMTVTLNTTQPMYVNVFNWNPYAVDDQQIEMIFPNRLDSSHRIDGAVTIPNNGKYSIRVSYPDTKGDASEFLHVVATRRPIRFLPLYSVYEFHTKLLEIPRQDRRYIRKPYRIVK